MCDESRLSLSLCDKASETNMTSLDDFELWEGVCDTPIVLHEIVIRYIRDNGH